MVAIGTEQGHCYLVDMCLDDDVEEFEEWNSSHLEILDSKNPAGDYVAEFRIEAKRNGAHIGIELGSKFFRIIDFYYTCPYPCSILINPWSPIAG